MPNTSQNLLSVLTQDEQKELGRLLKKLGLGLKERNEKRKNQMKGT